MGDQRLDKRIILRWIFRKGGYRVLIGKPGKRDHLGDKRVRKRIILRWIFRKWDVGVWTEPSWLRIETGGGLL